MVVLMPPTPGQVTSPSCSTSPATPRAGVNNGVEILCAGCGLPCSSEDSSLRSSRSTQRFHMICSSAYKRHQKICSKEPALKRAWIAKNASERQAWYRERYEEGSLGKGVKRSYDIVASETDEQSRMQDFRKLVFYEPFSAFEDRYIAVGRDGAFIRQLWRDRMSDPANFPRKMIGNVMHLGRYLGPMVVNHLCMCVGHWGGEEER